MLLFAVDLDCLLMVWLFGEVCCSCNGLVCHMTKEQFPVRCTIVCSHDRCCVRRNVEATMLHVVDVPVVSYSFSQRARGDRTRSLVDHSTICSCARQVAKHHQFLVIIFILKKMNQ